MLTSFNGFGLSPHPTSLLHHMHRHQPATSFRRSVTSSVRRLADGNPDVVFESRSEEYTGSGQKRVVIERGLGSKLMKLTQISDGCGGSSEERVFTNVSKEDETLFDDSNWHQDAAQLKLPAVPVQKAVMPSSASSDAGTNNGSGSIPKTADVVAQAPGEQEMDEHGVPITGSFEAREDGSFHETSPASTFSPAVNAEVAHDKPQSGQQQQQQQQVQPPVPPCVKRQEQQHEKCSRAHRSGSGVNVPCVRSLSRHLLDLQRLSSAFDPLDAWCFGHPRPHQYYAFAPVHDFLAPGVFTRPLLDVWG